MRLAAITLIVTVAPFTAGTEQSATDYLERGMAQYEQGESEEAIASFHKAIELQPNLPDAHYNLGRALHDKGELDEAIASYRKATELYPQPGHSSPSVAGASLMALAFLQLNLAMSLAEGVDELESIDVYLKAIERQPGPAQPDLAEAHYNLGLALRDKGELNEAIDPFLEAILYQPDLGVAYLRLSRILQDLAVVKPWRAAELEEGAGIFYRKAIEHQSDIGQSAEENHYRARALHERGEFDGAIAAYRNAIGVQPGLAEPDLVSAHNNLGRALHAMGELDEAIAAYRKAIELHGVSVASYRKAIELLVSGPPIDNVERGTPRFAPAEAFVRRGSSSLSPDFELPVVHHNLGRALHQKGELDEAIAAYRKAIELNDALTDLGPTSYDPEFTYYNLGTALHDRGKLDEAIYFYRATWPGERFRAETFYGLGLALREAGLRELDEARRLGFDEEPPSESTTQDGRDETTASTPSASPAPDGRTTTSESPPVASSGVGSEALIAYLAGDEFYREGAFAEAVASYRTAIELQPDMLKAHIKLAKTLLAMGQVDEAIAAYRTAIEIQPGILETHIERGRRQADQAYYYNPRPLHRDFMLSKAIRLHDAMTDLGRALHDKGELDETIPAYQEATLRAGRFRAEAQYELGLWLREDGERKLNDARRLGFNVVPPPPPATQDAKDQAMPPPPLYFGVGQVERAENYDSAAQAPDPAIDAYAAYQAGNAFRQESALREAVASYRKAVTLQPDMLEVHIELAKTLLAMGQVDEAIAAYRTAIPLGASFPVVRQLGVTFVGLGRVDEAIAAYRMAIELQPESAELHHLLGSTLRASGELDEAIASYGKAIELNASPRRRASFHYDLGDALRAKGELDEAIDSYLEAIELQPDMLKVGNMYPRFDFPIELGTVLVGLGRLDEAIAVYRKGIEIRPYFAVAHLHHNLGLALREAGQEEEAQEHLDEARRLGYKPN